MCIDKFIDHESVKTIKKQFSGNMSFSFVNVYIQAVYKSLPDLDPTKATGYDNISPKLLKLSATNFAHPLTYLINEVSSTTLTG